MSPQAESCMASTAVFQGGEDWEAQPLDLNDLPSMGDLPLLSPDKSQPTRATVNEILLVKQTSVQTGLGTVHRQREARWQWQLSWCPQSISWHLFAFLYEIVPLKKGPKCSTGNQNASSLLSSRSIILSKNETSITLTWFVLDYFDLICSWQIHAGHFSVVLL